MDGFIDYIHVGKFKEARMFIKDMTHEQRHDFIVKQAFESGHRAIYTFVIFLLIEKQTAALHYTAFVVIAQAFAETKGSESMGLFHARRAVELAPDEPQYKEYLLLFYDMPGKLLKNEEIIQIAQALWQQDPINKKAHELLIRIGHRVEH